MLHIVSKSPYADAGLESALAHWREGDAIILIEDAVVAALAEGRFAAALAGKSLHLLAPDLEARGLSVKALLAGAIKLDYEGFVDLCAAQSASLSWL